MLLYSFTLSAYTSKVFGYYLRNTGYITVLPNRLLTANSELNISIMLQLLLQLRTIHYHCISTEHNTTFTNRLPFYSGYIIILQNYSVTGKISLSS